MTAHNFTSKTADAKYLKTAATCTAKAVYYTSCTGCGLSSKGTSDEATFEDGTFGHKYNVSVVKPTYSTKGYTLYKCSLCGDSYKDNFTDILVLSSANGLKTVTKTDTSVTISWNRNADADGYIVEWYIGDKWQSKTVEGNENISLMLENLSAGSMYKVRIRAYKGELYSDYSYFDVSTEPSDKTDVPGDETPANTETPSTETPTTGDSSKGNTNTGVKGVALVVDVALLATGTLIITKKRK